MIPTGDQWGPFAPGLDHAERLARLRSLRALARVYAGPRNADVCRLLAKAKRESAVLEPAMVTITRLAAIDRRNVLASYLRLSFPT